MSNFLLIDDHEIVLVGISALLNDIYPNCHIDHASDESEALDFIHKNQYDLVIMDLNLNSIGGINLLRSVKEYDPLIKVLVLSMNSENVYALHVIRLGAKGFVSKKDEFSILKSAILRVMSNRLYLSDKMNEDLVNQGIRLTLGEEKNIDPYMQLTRRELEIVQLICTGASTKEISIKLGLKINTVSTFKRKILDKLQLNNIVELIERSRFYPKSPL